MYNKLFLFLCLVVLSQIDINAQEYTIEEILPSGNVQSVYPNSINNNGVVVGQCYTPSTNGFIYENGVFNLINFSGMEYIYELAINDQNNFTASVDFPNNVHKGFFNYQYLPGLIPDYSFGRDINNINHIVGDGWDGQDYYIVVYDETTIIDSFNLGSINGSDLRAINDSGFVAGNDYPNGFALPYIYNYSTSQLTYLPDISSEDQVAYDMNNLNQVVGYYENSTSWEGFIWTGSSYIYLPDKSSAYAINDSGVVVGEFRPTNYPPQHAFVYDPVNGLRDLNDLIPPGSGWELLEASDINDNGQIVGGGLLNGVGKAFILTPNRLIITKPKADELFIAGEKDTIKWNGNGNADSLKITAILNWHTALPEEIILRESIPSDSNEFIWTIPDSLLSYKTKIRIVDKSNPSVFAESGSFRLKGYVLTRVKSDLTYEKFGRTTHAWQFGNADINVWPSTWWSQFTYSTSIDWYTNEFYDEEFHNIGANKFPDWPALVRAFGVNQCYWSIPIFGLIYRDAAVDFWKSKISNWGGSCFGFAVSSARTFYDQNAFISAFPEIPPFNNLYQFPNPLTGIQGDSIRYIINALFTHQFGKQHQQYKKSILNDTPTQTLNKIKNILKQDNPDGGLLRIKNQGGSGAHAIVFYKLVQNISAPNNYNLLVYDNSYPANLTATITIDTSANGGNGNWNYSLWPGWGGAFGLQSRGPISAYFNTPVLHQGPLDTDLESGITQMEAYVSRNSNIVITDSVGNSIGWVDSVLFNTIVNANPLISEEPSSAPPTGYIFPQANYRIEMSEFSDSSAFLYLYNDDGIYSYRRDDALSSQEDHLNIGDGFSISNPDQAIKNIELKTTMPSVNDEKVFQFKNVLLAEDDSIFVDQTNRNYYTFKNFGLQKSYDLKIKYNSDSFVHLFKHYDVSINQNSTHTLYPIWDSLTTASVKILIDAGNNGTIDDSLFIANQTTDIENYGQLGMPDDFYLSQNYPNPFNPITKIRFGVAHPSYVTLKVFDLLGREVATLVNEKKPAGTYEVQFDASKLSSGIYFYKLQAGSFVETKKMIVIK